MTMLRLVVMQTRMEMGMMMLNLSIVEQEVWPCILQRSSPFLEGWGGSTAVDDKPNTAIWIARLFTDENTPQGLYNMY